MDNSVSILQQYQNVLLSGITNKFYRSVNERIDWSARMIALKGPRGAGKTSLMLQRLKYHAKKTDKPLYITMEHPQFYKQASLFNMVQEYYQYGGRYLFIDEVHKYEHWSRELKVIYDGFPELKIVFSASSALEIFKGEADLSRRVLTYNFPGMSFREFINLKHYLKYKPLSFEEIINDHYNIVNEIFADLQVLPLFNEYLRFGYLPLIDKFKPDEYLQKLVQIINTSLFQDLQVSKNMSMSAINKLKDLLGIIAESVPYEPNISSIAAKTNISRETVYEFIAYLEQSKILISIKKKPKGITALQKPAKIYLENTNFNYALQTHPDIGTIRETFFLNQIQNYGLEITIPNSGFDFLVDNKYSIEVGGKNKSVKNKDIIVAADNIVVGWANTIPLWLFGFLY